MPNAQPSSETNREQLEESIHEACHRGDLDAAATQMLEHYGGEILGFLVGRMRSESDGAEVFSRFAEDLWKGLPAFRWQTSARSWSYTLARNACCRYQTSPRRRRNRNLALPDSSRFNHVVDAVRSTTKLHLRTEVKSKMRELREQLPDDDQTLLVLRIDRELSWKEIAVIMSGQGDDMDSEERTTWAARLRKRFQAVKTKLRELARREGLL